MTLTSGGLTRAAIVTRTLARGSVAVAVLCLLTSFYSILFGGFHFNVGPIRVSSSGGWKPFIQALGFGMAAALLFYRDAALGGSWDAVPRLVWRFFGGPKNRVTDRVLWAAIGVGTFLSLLACAWIARQIVVMGSIEGHWVYGYVQVFSFRPIVIFALVTALAAVGLTLTARAAGRHEWLIVFSWVLGALGPQALLCSLTSSSFEEIFVSDTANSYYTVVQQYDASTVLSEFSSLRDSWPDHARNNMPGKLILLYALELVSARPSVLPWLVVVVSNLGGVLLYAFVRDLFMDRQVAFFSLVLYLFVPGKLFFFPVLNTVTPVFVCACAYLVFRWLRTGRPAYAALSGVALFSMVFFEPLPLVMGLLFAALAAAAIWRGDLRSTQFVRQAGILLLAIAATYAAIDIVFGFDLMDALRQVGSAAVAFNVNDERPYSIWVRRNLLDFVFAVGICQAVLFVAVIGLVVRRIRRSGDALSETMAVLSLAIAAILLTLDLIGVNRGEIIRLWIFLACFFQIPAAYACARLKRRVAMALVLTTTILQDALSLSMLGFIVP
jgi:hypothetical protein